MSSFVWCFLHFVGSHTCTWYAGHVQLHFRKQIIQCTAKEIFKGTDDSVYHK